MQTFEKAGVGIGVGGAGTARGLVVIEHFFLCFQLYTLILQLRLSEVSELPSVAHMVGGRCV